MSETTSPNPDDHGKPSPVLIVFLIFPILGVLAAIALAIASGVGANNPLPTPESITLQDTSLVDKPAPNFELASLDGTRLRLSSFRGRPVFVNFWGTWCEPCRRELPAFEQFQVEQGSDGAIILAVNVAETGEAINQFFDEQGIRGLTVMLDENQDVSEAFAVNVFPTTYVIDETGVIRFKYYGEMTREDMASALEKLT